jgi:hypothetical protein
LKLYANPTRGWIIPWYVAILVLQPQLSGPLPANFRIPGNPLAAGLGDVGSKNDSRLATSLYGVMMSYRSPIFSVSFDDTLKLSWNHSV